MALRSLFRAEQAGAPDELGRELEQLVAPARDRRAQRALALPGHVLTAADRQAYGELPPRKPDDLVRGRVDLDAVLLARLLDGDVPVPHVVGNGLRGRARSVRHSRRPSP